MLPTLAQAGLGLGSGSAVGFTLGLVGGGGSILALPLLVYVVGISNPHIAIGTSAVAVSINAAFNLINHARLGSVKWRCAAVFSLAGVLGAYAGASLGKMIDGQSLLAAFAILMLAVSGVMLRRRDASGRPDVRLSRENLPWLLALGCGTGALSGFFGIGGGFLIVPALAMATGMPMRVAIGSSLVAVTAFGLTTSANYALSNFVDWPIALLLVAGGVAGGMAGARAGALLASRKGVLNMIFAGLIGLVAVYMLAKSFA
jgi:uncharacterized membrane protein YfcA